MNFLKKFQRKTQLNNHAGNRYQCPFCGYQSKDLEIVGHDLPVLKQNTLLVEEEEPQDKYPPFGINPEEDLFFCKKP